MDTSEELILIPVSYSKMDSLGQQITTELPGIAIFCRETSVSRSEWESAARSGLRAEYKLIVDALEYNGEEIAEYKGERYKIYRTFGLKETDEVELYLGKRAGV